MINLNVEGIYDKTKRYIVSNWTNEDFTQEFGQIAGYNGDKVVEEAPRYSITIKAGEMRELGQFEAFIVTKNLITREMYKMSSTMVGEEKKSLEMSVNNEVARAPYIEKTIKEIVIGESNPFMEKIREEIRAEELAKLGGKKEAPAKEVKEKVKEETKETTLDGKSGEFSE